MSVCWPVKGGYRQRDHAPQDDVGFGQYWRVNWLGHSYNLLGVPSVHEGDDVVKLGGGDYGDPIYAIADGVVTYAQKVFLSNGQPSSWGRLVVIRHPAEGVYSRYAHLKEMLVAKGEIVTAGQPIGTMGNADGMLPIHLHFSISPTERDGQWPTDWPSSGRSAAEALAIIRANYTDPLAWLRSHMADNPVDTAKFLRDWLAARPNDTALVIASIPPQREPLGTRDAIETDIPTLLQVVTPPAPPPPILPPPGVTTTKLKVNTTVPLNLRSTPGGLVVGSLLPQTEVDAGETSGTWTHVYHPAEGWVATEWLSPLA